MLVACDRLVNPPFYLDTLVQVLKGETVEHGAGKPYGPDNEARAFIDAFISVFEVMTGLGLTMIFSIPLLMLCSLLYDMEARRDAALAAAAQLEWAQTELAAQQQALLLEREREHEQEGDAAERGGAAPAPAPAPASVPRRSGSGWLRRTLVESVTWAELAGYAVFCLVYAVDNYVIVTAQGDDFFTAKNASFPDYGFKANTLGETIERYFILPGGLPSPFGSASYPVMPWIALTSLGIGMGFSLRKDTGATIHRMGVMSLLFLGAFLLVRLFGGAVGNYRGLPRGDGQREGFLHVNKPLAFFILCKYPPSLAFTLLFLGTDIGIMWLMFESMSYYPFHRAGVPLGWRKLAQFLWDTLNIYGQVPLVFYLVHFWLLGPASAIAAVFTDNFRVPLWACTLIWLTVLAVLRPICQRYGAFKATTPKDSLWRYL